MFLLITSLLLTSPIYAVDQTQDNQTQSQKQSFLKNLYCTFFWHKDSTCINYRLSNLSAEDGYLDQEIYLESIKTDTGVTALQISLLKGEKGDEGEKGDKGEPGEDGQEGSAGTSSGSNTTDYSAGTGISINYDTIAVKDNYLLNTGDIANGNYTFQGTLDLSNTTISNRKPLTFEGDTIDNNETIFEIVDPTGDRTISFPNQTGEVSLLGQSVSTSEIENNSVTGSKIALGSDTHGDLMYYDGNNWTRLIPGTSGQYLKTTGVGSNPEWADISGGGILIFTTVALAEVASAFDNDIVYVVETETFYKYEASGSSYTDDNQFALSTGDGGNTRWIGVSGQFIIGSVNINKALNLAAVDTTSDYGATEEWLFNQLHADTSSSDLTITFPTPANMVNFPDGASRYIVNTGTGRLYLDPNGNSIEGDTSTWVIANGGFMEFTKIGSNIVILTSEYAYISQEPDDLSNLEIWLDAELGITESGGAVSQWVSQDSNSRTFSQATGGSQPVFNSSDLNGRATVENDAAKYMSAGSGFNIFNNTSGRGIYGIALVYTTNTGTDYIIGKSQNGQRAWRFGQRNSIIYEEKDGNPYSRATQGISTNQWQVMEMVWNPGEGVMIYIDGVKQSTAGTVATTIDIDCTSNLQIFDLQEGGDFDGKIAELIMYSDVPTAIQRQNLRNYLSTKFALQDIGESATVEVSEPNRIVVAKDGGDYTVLADALASITDATSTNRYVVVLGQGEWTEDITIPDYVYISGRSTGSVINGQVTFNSDNFAKLQNIKVKDSGTIPIVFDGDGKYYIDKTTVVGMWFASGEDNKALFDVQEGNITISDSSAIFIGTHDAGYDQSTIYYVHGSDEVSLKSFSNVHALSTDDLGDDITLSTSTNTNSSTLIEVKNGYFSTDFSGTNHANDVVVFYGLENAHNFQVSLNQIDINVSGTTHTNFDFFSSFIYHVATGNSTEIIQNNNDYHFTNVNDSDKHIGIAEQDGGTAVLSITDDVWKMDTNVFPDTGGSGVVTDGDLYYTIKNGFGGVKQNGGIITSGNVDFSEGSLEIPNSTNLPATCSIGQLFHDTDSDDCIDTASGDGALCICKSSNSWTLISDF